MEEQLIQVDQMIKSSNNIPPYIKNIVLCICKAYIRESNGKIGIENVKNVCNTTFIEKDENDLQFRGTDKHFAETNTNYDQNCNIIHEMAYVKSKNIIKLIIILTHELGHILTETKPCTITKGIYPYAKRTCTLYQNCFYQNDILMTQNLFGYRMADGFLESISTKIFEQEQFRKELKEYGYDLEDYVYKDKRLFPSRAYDEFKACFELFDYIMDGKLFEFSCQTYTNNQKLVEDFINLKLETIFKTLDKSNNAIMNLKLYEDKKPDEQFEDYLNEYIESKQISLYLAQLLQELYGKDETDETYQQLYNIYANTIKENKTIPLPESITQQDENKIMTKIVYHGSEQENINILEPRISTHQKKCVYATDDKATALLFTSKGNGDLDTMISSIDGKLTLVERRPNILNKLYNKKGYLYILDAKTFNHYDYLWCNEVISFEPVEIKQKIEIPNILKELEKEEQLGNIKIYRYPDRPTFVPLDNSDLIEKYINYENKGLTNSIQKLLEIYPEFEDQINIKKR